MTRRNILVSALGIKVGGGEILAMELANELAKEHNVVFFYHWPYECDEALQKRIFTNNVKVHSMNDFPRLNFLSWKINALLSSLGIKKSFHNYISKLVYQRVLKQYNIEIVSSHCQVSDKRCIAWKEKNIPVVITEHGEYVMDIASEKKEYNQLLIKADKIVCVSNFNRNTILERYPDLSSKTETIYNGVVLKKRGAIRQEVLKKLGLDPNSFVFGMVSRGLPEKGWEQLIEAFIKLQSSFSNREVSLMLVGGSIYLDELAEKYQQHKNIIFTGFAADPLYYIRSFDVGILPSRYKAESFPLTILEYIIGGIPVIATNVGGISEMIHNSGKKFGQLIQSGASSEIVAQLITAMSNYLTDKDLYEQHVDHEHITEQKFSMKVCAENYVQVFDHLLKENAANYNSNNDNT